MGTQINNYVVLYLVKPDFWFNICLHLITKDKCRLNSNIFGLLVQGSLGHFSRNAVEILTQTFLTQTMTFIPKHHFTLQF